MALTSGLTDFDTVDELYCSQVGDAPIEPLLTALQLLVEVIVGADDERAEVHVLERLIGLVRVAGEFAVHYHLDWGKEQFVRRNRLTTSDTWFWWALGLDQMMHGLTYVALIWLSCLSAAPG